MTLLHNQTAFHLSRRFAGQPFGGGYRLVLVFFFFFYCISILFIALYLNSHPPSPELGVNVCRPIFFYFFHALCSLANVNSVWGEEKKGVVTPKAYFSVVACITRFAYRHSTHTQLLLFSGAEERSTKYPRKVRASFFFSLVALQFVAHIHINFSFILASEWLKKEKNGRKNWDAKNLASFKRVFFY